MINAPVGTILSDQPSLSFLSDSIGNKPIFKNDIKYAIEQGFIELYTPEPKHWRAKPGGDFWYIDENGDVQKGKDRRNGDCDVIYNSNNYYRTKATAELVAKARKLELEWLHDKEALMIYSAAKFNDKIVILRSAMDEARKAVLLDDGNE